MPTRAELKQNAKNSMRGHKPSVYLVALVYIIIIYVLEVLTYKVMFPGMSAYDILMNLQDSNAALPDPSAVGQILQVAIEIMTVMIGVGFSIFCLHVSRGIAAGMGELFDAFGMFFKFLWLNIVMAVFIWLWSLLLIVPGIIAAYRYSMAVYIMIDNPEYSAMECIRGSKQMMMGHKGELFLLDLSFIGWAFLSIIPFVCLYTMPYFEVTTCNFYNSLSSYIPQVDYTVNSGENSDHTDAQNDSRDPWDR